MSVRWIVPLLIVVSARTASAQSTSVLSGRVDADAQFARKLFERGQIEMADSLCTLLEKSGKLAGAAQVTVQSLHIDLRIELAKKTADLAKRKDLLKQALQDKEDFVKQHAGSPEGDQAALALPDLYAQLGDTLKLMIKAESQPTVVADYQQEGQKLYQEAHERLRARIDELTKLKEEKDEKEIEDPKLEETLMGARFNLPRTLYGQAQLYGKDEFRRKDLLEQAIKQLQEFGLDYTGVVYSYQATILEGQCQKELGNNDAALAIWTQLAQELEAGWEPDKSGMFQIGSAESDLVAAALLQKALLLTELNRASEGVAEIKDYFAKYVGSYEAFAGLALLYQLGEMQLAAGDTDGAQKTADKLVELDGNGPWGANGLALQNKILGKGGSEGVGVEKLLALARGQFNRRNETRALELCRQAAASAKADPAMSAKGLEAFQLMGDIFRAREWYHEAALAYDSGAERYPNEADAPEAVYQALQSYVKINETEKRPYFKRRIDDRMKLLTTKYPNHPRASFALIVEGQNYEADDDFLTAAKTYEKVQPGAKSYLIAQYQAGSAYFRHARQLTRDAAKKAEAKPFFETSISMLKKSTADLEKAAAETFDVQEQKLYVSTGFRARVTLAQVQLDDDVNQPEEALKTLAAIDENPRYLTNADNVATAWTLRIQAYNKMGKLEDAAKNLDGLLAKSPDSPAIATAAGAVAREYDKRGQEASDKKDERGAEDFWKRAAKYYRISGQAQLKSPSGRASEVSSVAERLFILGLILNKAPDSFLGWRGAKSADPDYWRLASDLYRAALEQSPSRKGRLYRARALGFLGQWEEAANDYATFFETLQFADPTTNKINLQLLADPDNKQLGLVNAYIEWAVCENRAGKSGASNAADRFANALKLFGTLNKNPNVVVPDSAPWWTFKYEQVQALVNKGDYNAARIELNQVERQTNKLGGTVPGLADDFKLLKADIEKNTFNKNGIQSPAAPAPAKPR